MEEQIIKLPRYTIEFKQLAKDSKWIAEGVKVRADDNEILDNHVMLALEVANKHLKELNK